MGTLIGHVLPGLGFFVIIGLWHLFNNIKLYILHPKSYVSSIWFTSSRFRYLELYAIIFGSTLYISTELFIGPNRHQPLDPDGTISSNHLHNVEHSSMTLMFLIYAVFSIILDKLAPPARKELTAFLAAVAFGDELLLFHLHSSDHTGLEGQYHWLLQVVIFTSLVTTLIFMKYPNSFLNNFVRSISILFQGIWLMVMGIMLWTPSVIPKGCYINPEDGHKVVRCHSEEALDRAKSLVNIEFSWYVSGVVIFSMTLYLVMHKVYSEKVEYQSLPKFVLQDEDDIEAQKKANNSKIEE